MGGVGPAIYPADCVQQSVDFCLQSTWIPEDYIIVRKPAAMLPVIPSTTKGSPDRLQGGDVEVNHLQRLKGRDPWKRENEEGNGIP